MLNNIKLGKRLIGSFLIMALIVGITGIFGAISMKGIGDKIQDMLQNLASQQKLVLLMGVTQKECRVFLLQASFVHNDTARFEEYSEDYRMKRDLFKSQCDVILKGNKKLGIKPAPAGGIIVQRTNEALKSWQQFEAVAEEIIALKGRLLASSAPDVLSNEKLHSLVETSLKDTSDKSKESVDDLMVAVGTLITQANNDINRIQRIAPFMFLLAIVVAVCVAILLGVLITKYILSRIKKMGFALDRSSEGDLSVRVAIDSGDELGKLSSDFNTMVERLCEMVLNINRSTIELNSISNKITDASRQVSNAARVQANGVRETSSAVIEISSSVKSVGENVDRLSGSASESSSSILEMAASIEEVALNVETLAMSVEEVSSSIVQMTASIKQIGSSVSKLMDASTTTACSIAEMDSSIKQVEQNALDTVVISNEVRTDAESGKSSVDATILGINEIRRASRITSDAIESLYSKAEDIGKILLVIDEVAEQTNLLALNAAIIAAQAGSYGKGFAVVADEIKELSERTSSSTREISQVIKGVQDETRRAVDSIELAEKSIHQGEILSQNSGEALNKIVIGVQKSTERMEEIARATVEQSKGSQMIRDAMEQVSEMVTQIAKATSEQGKGSDMIMSAVEKMKGLTNEVRRSTREQAKVGNFIAQATENITGMIQQIKQSTDEQRRGSEQIVHAVKDIQQSTQITMDATRVLEDAVTGLADQTEVFQQEMSNYKV
ncbi:HAMP domain-containing protein [Geobacter pelophilus]|uniref:HAMP domain-containing protein n=1 Tax=Geoanaerobacter pelophilus TaxID=60036 RepID=A0AAW4L3J0_9BACT|nr:HAMP domain-containing methyl-accepting chemotaxis protein [Geoanaerobacter pelophilus]MBT0663190.1 HAMP domain-containing protein [Geoanaerobacter pelophilus]